MLAASHSFLCELGMIVGAGTDDHELDVIGWATCWDGCDDDAHRGVAEFLVSRGARHHIFSAIAMNLADEVRRLVAAEVPAAVALAAGAAAVPHAGHAAVAWLLPGLALAAGGLALGNVCVC